MGDALAQFKVYIANRPSFSDFSTLDSVNPLTEGEIHAIGQACGNGWRKVFNVYAKLLFALHDEGGGALHGTQSWQGFRDLVLLQQGSNTSLLFSTPQVYAVNPKNPLVIHIIMGKTYAKSLGLAESLTWLDHEFAIDTENKLVVCPYFDYRQLSNIKIIRLVELINRLKKENTVN